MSIEQEYKELSRLLDEYLGYKVEKKKADVIPFNDVVHSLTSLPAGDTNYNNPLKKATEEELRQAIEILENDKKGKHKTRIKVCKDELDRRGKSTITSEVVMMKSATPSEKTEETVDEDEYEYPEEGTKPQIILLHTEGNMTYEDCEKKLTDYRDRFIDSNSQYVIEGIAEVCKVDPDFRNNFMREDKTYYGFMEYMFNACINGYCIRYGKVSWLDMNLSLSLAIDYFNADIEKMEEEKKKKREAELKKRKAETAKKKKEVAKNGRKKTTTRKKKANA